MRIRVIHQSPGRPAPPVATLEVRSPAFQPDQPIPREHASRLGGEGQDVSPPLEWVGSPRATVEHVLIVDDADAPWVHWVLYGIPGAVTSLKAGLPAGRRQLDELHHARQGVNGWGELGWGGPLPPKGQGKHRYRFTVHALAKRLELLPGGNRREIEAAMAAHVIGRGELVGTYER